ncbi:hypothetical protein MEA186_00716 [Mesorhizobium amorphae CCNWGS0123]|uniref:Uncharacterized protein n=1 Tax=Mesorhizobium amorphae CCNWGS0123 TaxID=1082933 RepID=G6Y2K2_9HYPH|nr:hypothetical protein MEA186_00716 [Mesorhizobium amorphae CCNWGS0123]
MHDQTGVIDQDIDPAELLEDFIDESPDRYLFGHIKGESGNSLAAMRTGRPIVAQVADNDNGALFGKLLRDRTPYALIASSDDGDLA